MDLVKSPRITGITKIVLMRKSASRVSLRRVSTDILSSWSLGLGLDVRLFDGGRISAIFLVRRGTPAGVRARHLQIQRRGSPSFEVPAAPDGARGSSRRSSAVPRRRAGAGENIDQLAPPTRSGSGVDGMTLINVPKQNARRGISWTTSALGCGR